MKAGECKIFKRFRIAYADKIMSLEDYHNWAERYEIARNDPNQINKMKKNVPNDIEDLELELESNLTFRGIVGLEDVLQENVQETILLLRNAGIKICMLTGDKVETAKNIAVKYIIKQRNHVDCFH